MIGIEQDRSYWLGYGISSNVYQFLLGQWLMTGQLFQNYVFLNYISFTIFNIFIFCFYHFLHWTIFYIFDAKNQVITCIFFFTLIQRDTWKVAICCVNWQLGWIEKLKHRDQINQEEEGKRTVSLTSGKLKGAEVLPSSFWLITELVAIIMRLLSKDSRPCSSVCIYILREKNVHPNVNVENCMWWWIRALFSKQWNWKVIESEWGMKKKLIYKTLPEERMPV